MLQFLTRCNMTHPHYKGAGRWMQHSTRWPSPTSEGHLVLCCTHLPGPL